MKKFIGILVISFFFTLIVNSPTLNVHAANNWNYNGITVSKQSPQPENSSIKLTANVSGTTSELQYKFVWMTDNWKKWGVIKDFSTNKSVDWNAPADNYTLFVDVKDPSGKINTKTLDYKIDPIWWNKGITANWVSPQPGKSALKLTANVSGNTSGLQYKFVWMADNWKRWGVIRDFNSANNVLWNAPVGSYTLFMDAKDSRGRISTKTLNITSNWNYNGITANKQSPQPENSSINLTANVSGTTSELQYKFVWMTDNWKKWGVIKDFSTNKSVDWNAPADNYTLFVDVKDPSGKINTKTLNYKINPIWWNNGIITNKRSPQPENSSIKLTANVSGTTSELQYKFVWMTDNWKKWGVIKDFSTDKSVDWIAPAGNYTLFIDVKGPRGRISTKTLNYKINPIWWNNGIITNKRSPQPENSSIKLTANVSGTTSELQYKFVWMTDNWKKWGVIKDFSTDKSVDWIAPAGNYTLFIDVKGPRGRISTKTLNYKIDPIWWNNGITLDRENTQRLGTTFKLAADVSGNTAGLRYKFVWMMYNWEKWGVIKNFSATNNASWKPTEPGNYTLFLDIEGPCGRIVTKTQDVYITLSTPLHGIDVSDWQKDINWQAVKDSRKVQFAMIRSGWSTGIDGNETDRKFYQNVKNAKAVGMPIGVYHYSYAKTPPEARDEAKYCLSIIKGHKFDYPIVFDIEEPRMEKLGKDTLTNIVKAFCDTISEAGYYAAFYANPHWLNNLLNAEELVKKYDLWLAHWGVDSPSRKCGIWQYTSEGSVPGIVGHVDLDYAYKDYPTIMRSLRRNGY